MILLAVICLGLIAALVFEKHQNSQQGKEWATERAELLQRIQAPDRAVKDHDRANLPKPPRPRVIDVDDDAALNEVIEERS